MQVTEFIEALQALYKEHGDCEVVDEMDDPVAQPEISVGEDEEVIVLTFWHGP